MVVCKREPSVAMAQNTTYTYFTDRILRFTRLQNQLKNPTGHSSITLSDFFNYLAMLQLNLLDITQFEGSTGRERGIGATDPCTQPLEPSYKV